MIYSLGTGLKWKQNRLQKIKKHRSKKSIIKKVIIKKADLTHNKF